MITGWVALSLLLHLAVGVAVVRAPTRHAGHELPAITVTIETPVLPLTDKTVVPSRQQPSVRQPVATPPLAPEKMVPTGRDPAQHLQPDHAALPLLPAEPRAAGQSPVGVEAGRAEEPRAVAPVRPLSPASVQSGQPPAAAAPGPTAETVQQHYLKEHFAYIRDLLRKQLVYPTLARKMGWSGRAVVTFTVLEDGSVQKIRITESSGFSLLDKSALETVRTAAPFPRPPIRAEITVPVNFAMGP